MNCCSPVSLSLIPCHLDTTRRQLATDQTSNSELASPDRYLYLFSAYVPAAQEPKEKRQAQEPTETRQGVCYALTGVGSREAGGDARTNGERKKEMSGDVV